MENTNTKYEYLFESNELLLNLGRKIIAGAKNENIKTNFYRCLAAFFCVKAYFTSYSIYKLCKEEMGPDAIILSRCLFEIWINFKYISEDPYKLSEKYWKYESLEKNRLVGELKKSKGWKKLLNKIIKEKGNEIESSYNLVRGDYENEYKWSGKTILQLIRELEPDAVLIYSDISSLVHSQPSSAREYLKDLSLDIDLNKNLNYIPQAMSSSYTAFLFILEKFNEVFSLNYEEALKRAKKRIKKFSKYCK